MCAAEHKSAVWPRPKEWKRNGEISAKFFKVKVEGSQDWLGDAAKKGVELINGKTGGAVKRSGRGLELVICGMDYLPKNAPSPVGKAEGYILDISEKRILLAGADERGVYYGAQTLAQLIDAEGRGMKITGGEIRDWPRFPIRGVHLYLPPRDQFDFFRRVLDLLAEWKLNTIILEIGGGMEYERHPEINRAWKKFCKDALAYDFDNDKVSGEGKRSEEHFHPMFPKTGPVALQVSQFWRKDSTHTELAGGEWLTKDEVRELIRDCRERCFEIIPEVQSLSHSYYLCCAHPEIAEQRLDPWPDTYCPSNPRSYELLFDVMDEVIDLFQPRVMHIGHDEAYTFRVCPECRKRTGHEILTSDVTRIRDFLDSRGVRPLMWGDKFLKLHHGGSYRWQADPVTGKKWVQPPTHKAVDKVPKDVMICDWYWSLYDRSEKFFHEKGFDLCYGNFSPLGFKDWNERSATPNVLGAEMSSWCEVSPEEFGHNKVHYQFHPGAQMLWFGEKPPRDELVALMARAMPTVIDRLERRKRWASGSASGEMKPIDIYGVADPMPDELAGKISCGGELCAVTGAGPIPVLSGADGRLERAIILDAGRPKAGPVAVEGEADRLLLLIATTMEGIFHNATFYSYHRDYAVPLLISINYADGKRRVEKAIYGEHFGPLSGSWPSGSAGWCYRSVPVPAGDGHTLYAMEIVNPRPEAQISSLSFKLGPDATDNGVILIATVGRIIERQKR